MRLTSGRAPPLQWLADVPRKGRARSTPSGRWEHTRTDGDDEDLRCNGIEDVEENRDESRNREPEQISFALFRFYLYGYSIVHRRVAKQYELTLFQRQRTKL